MSLGERQFHNRWDGPSRPPPHGGCWGGDDSTQGTGRTEDCGRLSFTEHPAILLP